MTSHTPLAAMPAHDGTPAMPWLTGEIALIRDVVGGDLVAFFRGSTSLRAAVSPDLGVTWAWVDPAALIAIPAPTSINQDSSGKVHLLNQLFGLLYARLALSRNAAGHVTGFSAEVTNVSIPAGVGPEPRTTILAGRDQAGNPVLFYSVFDSPYTTYQGRMQAGKTTVAAGWAPTTSADFVKLDGTAGATLLFTGGSAPIDSAHNNGGQMAQHPVSRDLWFQWGPIDTGDTIIANQNPVRRLRATPDGPTTWALGTTVVAEPWNVYAAESGAVISTPTAVWMARFSPTAGLVIDRADATGTVTPNAIPSPHPVPRNGGYFGLSVNAAGTRAWVGGWISYVSATTGPAFWMSHWNGTTWQRFTDVNLADTWGVGMSVGWEGGLALVALDAATYAPSFSTLRTVP